MGDYYDTESEREFDKERCKSTGKTKAVRERNSKLDRVNEFTLTAHIYILNSLATHGAFGTMVNHAMSCFSTIRNHYCCMQYSKTSIKTIFMCVFVCSNAFMPACVYT